MIEADCRRLLWHRRRSLHYSIDEITKSSDSKLQRCTLKEIPKEI